MLLDADLHHVAMRCMSNVYIRNTHNIKQCQILIYFRYMLSGPMESPLVHYKLTKGPRVLRKGKVGSFLAL